MNFKTLSTTLILCLGVSFLSAMIVDENSTSSGKATSSGTEEQSKVVGAVDAEEKFKVVEELAAGISNLMVSPQAQSTGKEQATLTVSSDEHHAQIIAMLTELKKLIGTFPENSKEDVITSLNVLSEKIDAMDENTKKAINSAIANIIAEAIQKMNPGAHNQDRIWHVRHLPEVALLQILLACNLMYTNSTCSHYNSMLLNSIPDPILLALTVSSFADLGSACQQQLRKWFQYKKQTRENRAKKE